MPRQTLDQEFSELSVYKLKVEASKAGINIDDLYSDYETAQHEYEVWKYDARVMETHGRVSLVEMTTGPFATKPYKYEVSRELGEHQW